MLHSFWKVMPVFALSLGALALDGKTVGSHMGSDVEECEEKCCFACRERSCRQIACFCVEDGGDPCRPCWYTPLRECMSCWGGFIEVDFLYWGAQNNGFSYAIDQKGTGNSSVARIQKHWSPGFRIGLGYEFDYDFWNLSTNWTRYKNNHRESRSSSGATSGFYSMFPVLTPTNLFQGVSAGWNLLQNLIDLDLGKEYWLSKAFSLQPHWGLRAGWIHQSFATQLQGSLSTTTFQNFKGQNNWFGFGPRAGIQAEWLMGWGFSILGKTSVSGLYGNQKVNEKLAVTVSGVTQNSYISDRFNQFTPNWQMFLGAQWGLCLNERKNALAIQMGWETNYWWNQFHIPSSFQSLGTLPTTGNQPLELEGLTLSVTFDF